MKEIELCISEMRGFFQTGTTLNVPWRKKQLKALQASISQNENAILAALHADLGKSKFEGYATELGIVYGEIAHHLKHLDAWSKPRRVRSTIASFPSRSFVITQPLGVVLIMSPWNYPFQLTMAPLIAAIAAGNCAIVKPSRQSSHTTKVIDTILSQAFPSTFVTTITGEDIDGSLLLDYRFDHIFFTGSERVGKIVMQKGAQFLTPITLELGGKSPVIVDEGTQLKLAAKRIVWGKFLNAGQTCVAPDYILVHRDSYVGLLEELVLAIQHMYGTNPLNNSEYPTIIDQRHFSRLAALLENGTLNYGGQLDPKLLKIAPTLIVDPDLNSPLMTEEIFGPLLPVIPYDQFEQAVSFIEQREHPLALYFFGAKKAHQKRVVHTLSYGGGCINDTVLHLSNPHLPFGGVGSSGMGRYHAKYGFDTFSHKKGILKKYPFPDVPLRYAPFRGKLALLKRLMR